MSTALMNWNVCALVGRQIDDNLLGVKTKWRWLLLFIRSNMLQLFPHTQHYMRYPLLCKWDHHRRRRNPASSRLSLTESFLLNLHSNNRIRPVRRAWVAWRIVKGLLCNEHYKRRWLIKTSHLSRHPFRQNNWETFPGLISSLVLTCVRW